jgi:type III secretion system YscD/HrpQ family protein
MGNDPTMDKVKDEARGTMAMDLDGNDHAAGIEAETASGYQLKVLSGRHTGAIMPLPPGRHSLGQDEESDFIFLDDAFLGGRVIVDVTGAEPTIEVTGQVKATLEGRELAPGAPAPLPSHKAVEVGTTRFAIGPADQPWPEPAAPQPAETAPADAAAPAGTGDATPASAPAEQPKEGEAASAAPKPPRRRRGLWIAVAVPIIFAAALGGFAFFRPRPPVVDPAAQLRAMLVELHLPEVHVVPGPGGLLMKGFVRNQVERDSLNLRLEGFHHPVRIQLTTLEEIRGGIQGVLDFYHLQCPVTISPAGKATVACVLDNPGAAKEMTESLRQAMPPDADLDLRLYASSEAYAFLNRQLAARVLDHKIHPEARLGRIGCVLVKNQMDSLELKAWGSIRDSFRAQFGMDLDERWTERLSPVLQRFQNFAHMLDSQLVGVTVGEMSYITLKHRRKYFEGARLVGGLSLKSIRSDRLVLSLDNVEQNYFLKKGPK